MDNQNRKLSIRQCSNSKSPLAIGIPTMIGMLINADNLI